MGLVKAVIPARAEVSSFGKATAAPLLQAVCKPRCKMVVCATYEAPLEDGHLSPLRQTDAVALLEVPAGLAVHSQTFKAGMSPAAHELGQVLDFSSRSIALGGHRGMGQNSLTEPGCSTVYRENTLRSFSQAAACGATFVEFDVQVTSDGVPVIWHDDLVICQSSGIAVSRPICSLTLKEFKSLVSAGGTTARHHLLRNVQTTEGIVEPQLSAWDCEQDDELPTFAELFHSLPAHVAFDIEIKMTTPPALKHTPQAEVDRMLGPILDVVKRETHSSSRTIMFSSFDPEICLALKKRQPQFPVMFLTTGGACWHVDERRTSLRAAIEFSASAGLQGIIADSGVLHSQQGIVSLARNNDLLVMTYGVENNVPDWVHRQQLLGVHGAIVDDVAGVASALTTAAAHV